MNLYYQKIMELTGADALKRIVRKWDTLSGNIKQHPEKRSLLLPDMLWIAPDGIGKTKMLRLLSEYLSAQENLMDFYGDVKFFEFYMNYTAPSERFDDLRRLMREVRNAAGFRSEYRGLIYIDISEWIGHEKEKHFISFLEYLADNSEEWLVILNIPYADAQTKGLESLISMYLRLEVITMDMPSADELFDFVVQNLSLQGLTLEKNAAPLLKKTIALLREQKHFSGYQLMNILYRDLVYNIYSRKHRLSKRISADMLRDFAVDSEYVSRMVYKMERTAKIGFLDEEA